MEQAKITIWGSDDFITEVWRGLMEKDIADKIQAKALWVNGKEQRVLWECGDEFKVLETEKSSIETLAEMTEE